MDERLYINPVQDKRRWLRQRDGGIGGSDAPIMMGWNPYKPVERLWLEKRGDVESKVPWNRFMHWGSLHEASCLWHYAWSNQVHVLGRDWSGEPVVFPPSLSSLPIPLDDSIDWHIVKLLNPLTHPEYTYIKSNVDGYVIHNHKLAKILEIKAVDKSKKMHWKYGTPPIYLPQAYHNKYVVDAITGKDLPIEVCVLVGGNDFGECPVVIHSTIMNELIEREHKFWECVEDGSLPGDSFKPWPLQEMEGVKMVVVKKKSSRPRVLPKDGSVRAVCCDVNDEGPQDVTWQGQTRKVEKVSIHFKLEDNVPDVEKWTHPYTGEEIEIPEEARGKPHHVSRWFTKSLDKRGNLRKFLRTWRGKDLSPEEEKEFELDVLLGVNARLIIVHNENDGKWYANIDNALRADPNDPGLTIPPDYIRIQDRESVEEISGAANPLEAPDDDLPF